MHIINAMFSRGLGGIEQSFIDYCEAMKISGHKVTAMIFPSAKVKEQLVELKIGIIEIENWGQWDFIAKSNIVKVLKQINPDAIIAHGSRAVSLLKKPSGNIPLIGVTHNYSVKRLIGLDGIFATTDGLKHLVVEKGQDADTVFEVPNMIRWPEKEPDDVEVSRSPVVIGAMGRFVKKKGFDIYIEALTELKKRNIAFKALLGGTGEEEENLHQQARIEKLNGDLNFLGWVDDKEAFFESIDIFCLPSIHEPFGIILLEAFIHKKPVITTDSEGPSQIATDNFDSLVIPKYNHIVLANAIEELINKPEKAKLLAKEGYETSKKYDIKKVAQKIDKALLKITS